MSTVGVRLARLEARRAKGTRPISLIVVGCCCPDAPTTVPAADRRDGRVEIVKALCPTCAAELGRSVR